MSPKKIFKKIFCPVLIWLSFFGNCSADIGETRDKIRASIPIYQQLIQQQRVHESQETLVAAETLASRSRAANRQGDYQGALSLLEEAIALLSTKKDLQVTLPSPTIKRLSVPGLDDPTQARSKPVISIDSIFGIHGPNIMPATGPSIETVEDLVALGADWVRYDGPTGIVWDVIENKKGNYDWSKTDAVFGDTYSSGIRMIVVIKTFNQVDRGVQERQHGWGLPNDMTWYQEFLSAVAERYDGDGVDDAPGSPVVDVWEVENEPDNPQLWTDSPEKYALLLKTTYETIKAASPTAQVAFGSLATTIKMKDFTIPVFNELDRLKESQDSRYFDIFPFHWSGQFGNYRKHAYRDNELYLAKEIDGLQNELSKRDITVPIWLTETSFNDGEPEDISFSSRTETEQAIELVKRYIYPLAHGVTKFFWNQLTERKQWLGKSNSYFTNVGLINNPKNDGKSHKKLAYYTFRNMAATLQDAQFDTITTIQEQDGVYIYRLTANGGENLWILWSDNEETAAIEISEVAGTRAELLSSVPDAVSGEEITGNNANFSSQQVDVKGGKVTFQLGNIPLFLREQL